MRILLVAMGSTGDVQPMVVLGKTLTARGHQVTIAAFSALKSLVQGTDIDFFTLTGDAEAFIGSIIKPGASPITYLSRLETAMRGVIVPLLDDLLAACKGRDAIVTTFFGTTLYAIADAYHIPLFQSNYCHTDLTGDHCLPVMRQIPLGRGFNRATYRIAYHMIGMLEERYVRLWCKQNGIAARNMKKGPNYQLAGWTVPVLYAFSNHVVPRPPEWPKNIQAVGFYEDSHPAFQPPEDLVAFLSAGPAPLYVGFGSMTSGDMDEAMGTLLTALEKTGHRAIVSEGWGHLSGRALPDTVHLLGSFVPHAWLFERVSAVVHHGGAGTTAAGLRAGKPSLAVPFGSDQYFWGERIHALGCGPKMLVRSSMTPARLASRLTDLTSTPSYADNALRLSRHLRQEDGRKTAADLIEDRVKSAKMGHEK